MQPSTTDRSTAKQALLEALLSDAGLKSLTQTASTVMGNPVLVVDPVYRYAARGGFELDDADDPPCSHHPRRALRRRYAAGRSRALHHRTRSRREDCPLDRPAHTL
ncbi:hypothetical protein ACTQWD_00555 [Collinsella sp. LCP19S3_B6]|uniref:hypothetical protein n=1 Tax=Collinsella sp. LCP19S3_B6 TaxID=3438755 RepID=UPI003F91A472